MSRDESILSFQKACRAAFQPVLEPYDFAEERVPKKGPVNPCQFRWANATTRLVVEGINWGLNIDVRLASVDDSTMEYESYAFDDLLSIRTSSFARTEGQRAQMRQYAKLLAEHGRDVLSGDHSSFPALAAAIRTRAKEYGQR